MAATRYGERRRARKAAVRGSRRGGKGLAAPEGGRPPVGSRGTPRFVAVGTIANLSGVSPSAGPALSFLVNGRYEVRVGAGFDAAALARLVRTLEQL